jgi:hypothetical protein
MKKLLFNLFFVAALTAFSIQPTLASEANNPVIERNEAKEMERIQQRLKEIQEMDKTSLTKVEKKELRKEVKEMKKKIDGWRPVHYILAGAIAAAVIFILIAI